MLKEKLKTLGLKTLSFFLVGNHHINKKSFVFGVLLSPLLMALFSNVFYISKTISIYSSTNEQFSFWLNFSASISLIISTLTLWFFLYVSIKKKSSFMIMFGDTMAFFTACGLGISFIIVFFQEFNIFFCLGITFLNGIVFALNPLYYSTSNTSTYLKQLENTNFKFIFYNTQKNYRILVFFNNLQIHYYPDFVIIDQYKVNYHDISLFENQFNKRLYNFNRTEIDVVKMYAIN